MSSLEQLGDADGDRLTFDKKSKEESLSMSSNIVIKKNPATTDAAKNTNTMASFFQPQVRIISL
jgi:hypothetical protein